VIATIFGELSPLAGLLAARNTAGFFPTCPRRLIVEHKKLVRLARALFKQFRELRDGSKRNHGKVREKPRREGCGRHRRGVAPRVGGRNIIRLSTRRAALGCSPPVAAGGCRGETK